MAISLGRLTQHFQVQTQNFHHGPSVGTSAVESQAESPGPRDPRDPRLPAPRPGPTGPLGPTGLKPSW